MQTPFHFALAAPEILLLILTVVVLIADACNKSEDRSATFVLSLVSVLIMIAVSLWQWHDGISGTTFNGLYVADPLSHFLKILSYIAVAVTFIYGRAYAEQREMLVHGGELYTLTLLALLGQMVMISAGSLLMVYLAWN